MLQKLSRKSSYTQSLEKPGRKASTDTYATLPKKETKVKFGPATDFESLDERLDSVTSNGNRDSKITADEDFDSIDWGRILKLIN